jgi:ferredoxin-NADP reductase
MSLKTLATIREVIVRTPSVKSFRVIPGEFSSFRAGQWLFVTLRSDTKLKKPLSISSSPTEPGYLEFTKKLTSSDFSSALSALKPGDTVELEYPQGRFTFQEDVPKIAFLSGGIGITPIRSICRDLTDRRSGTSIVLIYGNNAPEEIAFKEDFERMQAGNRALKVAHVLRTAPEGWKGRTGFISETVIREEIPDFSQRRFYLCGPPPMVEGLKKILLESLKVESERIVTEGFAGYL